MRFFYSSSLAIVVFMLVFVACEIDNTVKTDEIWTYDCSITDDDTREQICSRTYYLPAGSDPEKASDRYLQRIKDDCCSPGSDCLANRSITTSCQSSGGALR